MNGKLTTTIVWGGTPPKGRATYRLDLPTRRAPATR